MAVADLDEMEDFLGRWHLRADQCRENSMSKGARHRDRKEGDVPREQQVGWQMIKGVKAVVTKSVGWLAVAICRRALGPHLEFGLYERRPASPEGVKPLLYVCPWGYQVGIWPSNSRQMPVILQPTSLLGCLSPILKEYASR